MTVDTVLLGVTATKPLGYVKRTPPPVAGFDFFSFTQDNAAYSVANIVPGGADGAWIGQPAVTSAAATLTQGTGIDTGVFEAPSMTFCVVVARTNLQVMFGGSHDKDDPLGANIFTNGAAPRRPVFQASWSSSGPAVVSALSNWTADPSGYEALFGIVDEANKRNILYVPRLGEWVTVACTGSRVLSGRHVILGSGLDPATPYQGDTVLFKAAGVASYALSRAECDAMYSWLQKRLAGL